MSRKGAEKGIAGVAASTARALLAMALLCLALVGPVGASLAQSSVQTASAASSPVMPDAARILAARLGDHGDKTRFVLELSRAAPFAILPGGSAGGLIVEMPAALDAALPPAKGLVRAVRVQAAPTPGRLRLVLATDRPVRALLAEVLPARDGMPPRFVLDIAPGPAAASGAAVTQVSASTLSPPTPKAKPTPPLPMVIIDAGHGGQDPGTVAVSGVYEKDIVLAVARELRRQLAATGRYRVALTRDKDVFIPLRERVAIARNKGADLFISLHADSIAARQVRGLSVYTLSDKASDREAEMLAQRENQADAIVGMDLTTQSADIANILIGLSQRDAMNQSRRFASLVVRNLDREVPVLVSPLRSAGLAVLTAPDVPSVLVELGYLSHPQDARLLASDGHRRRLAGSLLRAVDGYFSANAVPPRS